MPVNSSPKKLKPNSRRPEGDRRKLIRRAEDKVREQAFSEKARKLHSLLELGNLIGLNLQLNEMLSQIAQKACEVMDSDRCSLFLYDSNTDELWSTVALGMESRSFGYRLEPAWLDFVSIVGRSSTWRMLIPILGLIKR